MKIVEKQIEDVVPYERNPRNNDAAIDAVAESIRQFGFKQPIVVDSKNIIIAGHTRYKAAQKLGFKTVPCVFADDLTPKQAKAYRILDNKLAELATWDFGALKLELDELDFDLRPFEVEFFSTESLNDFFDAPKSEEKTIKKETTQKETSDTDDDGDIDVENDEKDETEENGEDENDLFRAVAQFETAEERDEFVRNARENGIDCRASD